MVDRLVQFIITYDHVSNNNSRDGRCPTFCFSLFPKQSRRIQKLRKRSRTLTIIFDTAQNAKKPHPAAPENTAIPQFEIKIPEISQEKWPNTAIPQTPMSPSLMFLYKTLHTASWCPPIVPLSSNSPFRLVFFF